MADIVASCKQAHIHTSCSLVTSALEARPARPLLPSRDLFRSPSLSLILSFADRFFPMYLLRNAAGGVQRTTSQFSCVAFHA